MDRLALEKPLIKSSLKITWRYLALFIQSSVQHFIDAQNQFWTQSSSQDETQLKIFKG